MNNMQDRVHEIQATFRGFPRRKDGQVRLNDQQAEFLAFTEEHGCTLSPAARGSRRTKEATKTIRVHYNPEQSEMLDESKRLATFSIDTWKQNAIICYARWCWHSRYLPEAELNESEEQREIYIEAFQKRYGDPVDRVYVEDREYKWYGQLKDGNTKWFLSILDLEAAKEILLRDIQEIQEISTPAARNRQSSKPNTAGASVTSCYTDTAEFKLPDEAETDKCHVEGAKKQITVNSYERDREARQKCVDEFKRRNGGRIFCDICEYDFGAIWGGEFEGYIHVHHRKALSEIGEEYQVDPIEDLVPVCPNCHAMIHHGGRTRELDAVKILWEIRSRSTASLG